MVASGTSGMSLTGIQDILDLLCYKLWWVEATLVQQVLGQKPSDSVKLDVSLRYLVKKGLVERHVVNCPRSSSYSPILSSSTNASTTTNLRQSTMAILSAVAENQNVWLPTHFYCASRVAAGLYGIQYAQPASVVEWQAHRRLTSAFLHHVGSSNTKRCNWRAVKVQSGQPQFLLAIYQSTCLCFPIELSQRNLNRSILHIRKKWFKYEIW